MCLSWWANVIFSNRDDEIFYTDWMGGDFIIFNTSNFRCTKLLHTIISFPRSSCSTKVFYWISKINLRKVLKWMKRAIVWRKNRNYRYVMFYWSFWNEYENERKRLKNGNVSILFTQLDAKALSANANNQSKWATEKNGNFDITKCVQCT